ncbi:hypothetical protein BLNAU_6988 [Blattamonas nauphoetae]|uniref:Uncharacterized protein n=1 Tax=Blattamonas nauphoetae TaxID=2049346 RepID=A0ABQ9Y2T9_9EUKA|nr:hypothetical protein BLNAU_6988 [Blattamonas nauphoetae]
MPFIAFGKRAEISVEFNQVFLHPSHASLLHLLTHIITYSSTLPSILPFNLHQSAQSLTTKIQSGIRRAVSLPNIVEGEDSQSVSLHVLLTSQQDNAKSVYNTISTRIQQQIDDGLVCDLYAMLNKTSGPSENEQLVLQPNEENDNTQQDTHLSTFLKFIATHPHPPLHQIAPVSNHNASCLTHSLLSQLRWEGDLSLCYPLHESILSHRHVLLEMVISCIQHCPDFDLNERFQLVNDILSDEMRWIAVNVTLTPQHNLQKPFIVPFRHLIHHLLLIARIQESILTWKQQI